LECRNHLAISLKSKIEATGKDLGQQWASCAAVLDRCIEYLFLDSLTEGDPIQFKRAVMRVTEETDCVGIFSGENLRQKIKSISEIITVGETTYAQLEALKNDQKAVELRTELAAAMAPLSEFLGLIEAQKAIDGLQQDAYNLGKWYAVDYRISTTGDFSCFTTFQEHSAQAAGLILSKVLIPQWRKEGESLVILSRDSRKKEETPAAPELANDLYIRNAEEFVSFPFLGFIQNILGRIRTIVIGIVALFIAVSLAISSYPFDPRHAINIVLLCVFGVIGGVIIYVYADMHRDATLSHLTNTAPGELGSDFWFKIIGFGIGPLIGLMATYFPEIGDFIISWLQPGINSLK